MDVDFSDATSNASSTVLDLVEADDLDEINVADTEDVEDLTAAAPGVSKDNGAEEVLQDAGVEELKRGGISVKPRPYQLEMLEESLKKNIIVAVRLEAVLSFAKYTHTKCTVTYNCNRWILVLERRMCKTSLSTTHIIQTPLRPLLICLLILL